MSRAASSSGSAPSRCASASRLCGSRALGLLYASYAGVAAALALGAARASTAIAGARRAAIAALSVAAIRSVRRRAKHVEPSDGGKVYDLYMHLWTLFYLSYVALPFVR